MTTLREAATLALEALKLSTPKPHPTDDDYAERGWKEHTAAITALRAALAEPVQDGCDHCNHPMYAGIKCRVCGRVTEPEQEPVAWMCPDDPERETAFAWKAGHCEDCGKQRVPLYTVPPQRNDINAELVEALQSIMAIDGYSSLSLAEADAIHAKARAALAKAEESRHE